MFFEFGQGLQAGLDCAGDVSANQGAVFGWVRHRAGDALSLRVETSPGIPADSLLLDIHPRGDVPAGEGMAVSGFSLVHDIAPDAAGRLLIIGLAPEGATAEEVAIDLLAYDLPVDVAGVTQNRQWGATYQLLHASASDPDRIKTLSAEGGPVGIFSGWLDRLPRLSGSSEWFMDFRRVAARIMPDGELAISGGFNLPASAGAAASVMACALLQRADGSLRVARLADERRAPLEGGFVIAGRVDITDVVAVEAVVEVRRGEQTWWFRAEATVATLPQYLDGLALTGVELSSGDQAVLHGWVREALERRGEALRGHLEALSLTGIPARPGGTALLFDMNDEYAARVLCLIAPQLESRFGRIVVSGTAAARAADALMRLGRLEVMVEGDAQSALAAAARHAGPVAPIDTATLVDAAIEGNPARLMANAIPGDRLPMIATLHGLAGVGDLESTLRRVVALMGGADPVALPMPVGRSDAVGGLVAEHLRGLWEMVPTSGVRR